MDNLTFAVIVVAILLIFYVFFYNPPHENMLTQMDWQLMSRGFNLPNGGGYTPTMRLLSAMEKSQGPGIKVWD